MPLLPTLPGKTTHGNHWLVPSHHQCSSDISYSGMELGVPVATIMTCGAPTGQAKTGAGEVAAMAKRDGEGADVTYGKLMPVADSIEKGLPIGLAHGIVLKRNVKKTLSRFVVIYSGAKAGVMCCITSRPGQAYSFQRSRRTPRTEND
ncbi:hypothetical protein SPBR_04501 [Sporothrix brasiliensis 5110]|uniref:Uncharacterized protein n=1 Tax=Sporothrix brasiliensis 5110 TaxID=1398154 RepID=A0A0C2JA25_9PEZI|nr:uncharacterized protein SPBR_04501 [Sporothrix brasiliensis 5110]KIH93777.1 hypothetical protein SPBR_04501 [Sporothrix brasiliensis 5110]